MTTFYLVRHAEKDVPGTMLTGRAPGVRLTAAGRRQAECLAGELAREPIRRVLSSPLERACETARPLAERLGLEVELSEAIGEIDFGAWTNQAIEALEPDAHWQRYHQFRSGHRIPEGELLLEVQARFVREMLRLRSEVTEGGVALFSHSDPIKLAIAYFAAVPLDLFSRFEIESASVSTITLTDWGPRIEGINRCYA